MWVKIVRGLNGNEEPFDLNSYYEWSKQYKIRV